MTVIADSVLDAGLALFVGSKTLTACSAEPADFAGIAAVALGNITVTVGAIADGATAAVQRRATVGAGTGGTVTTAGSATHYAVHDGTTLIYAAALAANQNLVLGVPFTTPEFDIFYPAPA